ncbi:tRNA methyltransferase 10 homolog A-like [Pecten maximus]|uniref:tRNA methyltransferase 10 homolog A-like n=1 Tax=Pecten maximus TaxID=6579 RepID=UPI001457F6E2|nr:tRNA methyltransferase 10 homolog A-like [Pecten maximus]
MDLSKETSEGHDIGESVLKNESTDVAGSSTANENESTGVAVSSTPNDNESTDVAGGSTANDNESTDVAGSSTPNATDEASTETQQLSKRQLRKLKKHENWLKYKPIKRIKDKEKKKQRRIEAKERGEPIPSRKKLKLNTMAKSECRVSVAIDCSFDQYMQERDILKLGKQIRWCYSTNRRSANPVQLHVVGINGQIKDRLDGVGDYKNWDIHSSEKGYEELFDQDSIVYLSSDSPNILTDLEPDKVYIIGGLVDHNHHKGLCHQIAVEKGLAHAQLPISEYIQLKSRKVLTINHVFEILLSYTETKDWQKAFYTVLPQRKGVELKDLSDPGQKESLSDDTSDNEESDQELSIGDQINSGCYSMGTQGQGDTSEGHHTTERTDSDHTSFHSDNSAGEKQIT